MARREHRISHDQRQRRDALTQNKEKQIRACSRIWRPWCLQARRWQQERKRLWRSRECWESVSCRGAVETREEKVMRAPPYSMAERASSPRESGIVEKESWAPEERPWVTVSCSSWARTVSRSVTLTAILWQMKSEREREKGGSGERGKWKDPKRRGKRQMKSQIRSRRHWITSHRLLDRLLAQLSIFFDSMRESREGERERENDHVLPVSNERLGPR